MLQQIIVGLLVRDTPFFHCNEQSPRRLSVRCADDVDLAFLMQIAMMMAEILQFG